MEDADHSRRVAGKQYVALLSDIHQRLNPRTYLEIGVHAGNTLRLAQCVTVAVDPRFVCETNIINSKPACFLYQQTSDAFFASNDLSRILGKPVDLAFLDGMHWFEFLLRDFINTEKYCENKSTIILHDCLPPGFYMTSRNNVDSKHPMSKFQNWWAGDVWKIVPTLQKYRSDLSITVVDSAPTGLVIVSGLNPQNDELSSQYENIIAEFNDMDRAEFDNYWMNVRITPSTEVAAVLG